MPELPEVESLVRQLRRGLEGARLAAVTLWTPSVVHGALPEPAGQKLLRIERRGKYLRFDFEGGAEVWFHLGMTGQMFLSREKTPARETHAHALFEFSGRRYLVFRDIRRFGGIHSRPTSGAALKAGILALGPDPFQITAAEFAALLKKRTGLIKALLLDQKLVSGIGNIYADESLFRAGIHPKRRPRALSRARLEKLHADLCAILSEAIEKGGSSINDYRHLNGASGRFQDLHRVYGKEGRPCRSCSSVIRRITVAARGTHFCPRCQT